MAEQHNRLEPFLILARGTKGAGAAKVVLDATAAAGVYTFGELLDIPSIKELANDATHEKTYRLVQLFAYGTLKDYTDSPDSFPALTPAHQNKLKHLTLLSLALANRSLPYAQLTESLGVSSTAELETVIIDTFYAGLLTGKIHHHEQVLHVDTVTGRDLRPESIVSVKTGLENWCRNAHTLLAALDKQISDVRARAAAESETNAIFQQSLDAAYLEAKKDVGKKGKDKGGYSSALQAGPYSFDKERSYHRSAAVDVDDGDDDELMDEDDAPTGGLHRSMDQRSIESIDERAKKRAKD